MHMTFENRLYICSFINKNLFKVNRQRPKFVMWRPELKIRTLAKWLISPLVRVIIKTVKSTSC